MNSNIWYPYTQAKTAPDPSKVKSAQGLWLELADGRKIADCISSWWVNLHGHTHPSLDLLSKNESVYTKMESWHR